MTKELSDFFKIISEGKKKSVKEQNENESLLSNEKTSVTVKATELKDFFSAINEEKKKLKEQREKDKRKLAELEQLLFAKEEKEKPVSDELDTESYDIEELDKQIEKEQQEEEPNLDQIKEAVQEANQVLLTEPSLVDQAANEITNPNIIKVEEKPVQEIDTDAVIKELSKISTNTGVVLNKDVSDLESLKKEFERFRKLVTQQLESIGGGGGGGSEDVDLSEVDQDIIPDANNTRSLGTSAKRWKDLFLSGQTINLGGATISSDGTGTVSVSATGVELPAGSKSGDNKLAVVAVDSRGAEQAAQVVPFFTKAGGLTTANTNFSFNATIDEKFVFTGSKSFTLANGSSLTDSAITLFQF